MAFQRILLCNQDTVGLEKVYSELRCLNKNYPDFSQWYHQKVISGLNINREILTIWDDEKIAGILITKRGYERKICTLRVSDGYRRIGIGNYLIQQSFQLLGTTKPIITVSENHLFQFNALLKRFDFDRKKIYHDYYGQGKNEYSFNGILTKDSEFKRRIAL